jgi:hypothetical protein
MLTRTVAILGNNLIGIFRLMKNVGILAILIFLTAGTWYLMSSPVTITDSSNNSGTGTELNKTDSGVNNANGTNGLREGDDLSTDKDSNWADIDEDPIEPATDLYTSAADALEAVRKGAKEYDDIILEQFVDLGPACTWCDEFYGEVKQMMLQAESDSDEQAYFAELLTISGKPENVETVVDILKKTDPQSADFDVYLDALEMTVGGEDVVKVLSENLDVDNPDLRESVVAAISNQGSAFAVDTLYKHVKEAGVKDGYYSAGVGIGELIPEEEAFPLMREVISNRDEQSPEFVKGLLNAGVGGLREVYEALNSSTDVEGDKNLLKGAMDHIPYDDETEKYLREVVVKSTNPALKEFGEKALKIIDEEDN